MHGQRSFLASRLPHAAPKRCTSAPARLGILVGASSATPSISSNAISLRAPRPIGVYNPQQLVMQRLRAGSFVRVHLPDSTIRFGSIVGPSGCSLASHAYPGAIYLAGDMYYEVAHILSITPDPTGRGNDTFLVQLKGWPMLCSIHASFEDLRYCGTKLNEFLEEQAMFEAKHKAMEAAAAAAEPSTLLDYTVCRRNYVGKFPAGCDNRRLRVPLQPLSDSAVRLRNAVPSTSAVRPSVDCKENH